MTLEAARFLKGWGIDNIISLNKYPLSTDDVELLHSIQVAYSHIGVEDYCTTYYRTAGDCHFACIKNKTTLVYCGYGHGRTGTAISALQISMGRRLNRADYRQNLVETE